MTGVIKKQEEVFSYGYFFNLFVFRNSVFILKHHQVLFLFSLRFQGGSNVSYNVVQLVYTF